MTQQPHLFLHRLLLTTPGFYRHSIAHPITLGESLWI
jgi:hypothetical protein